MNLGIGSRLKHKTYGEGVLAAISLEYFTISFPGHGLREIDRKTDQLELIESIEPVANTITFDEVEDALMKILKKYIEPEQKVELGNKWKGGLMVLEPADQNQAVKEIPIETFFHKIVMVRDRLRVLEQNVNSHKGLSDEEKVNLQQYITKIYGSLTTFNVLFKNEEDHFKGEGGK
ncbi:MAG: hypothetical protein H6605_01905 [Flavobacteriales bacterium]|nr:hypothetical protein [Flavobacteriales bacterium]